MILSTMHRWLIPEVNRPSSPIGPSPVLLIRISGHAGKPSSLKFIDVRVSEQHGVLLANHNSTS
jgi:hypothetical protein